MKKNFLLCSTLLIIFSVNSAFAELVWVPAEYANAKKGDILLQGDPNNFIGKLLAIFGGYWSHSGMMIEDYTTIRHNTMEVEHIKQDKNWLGIPYRLNPHDLENGSPGTITTTVDHAYQHGGWDINTGTDVVLTLSDDDEDLLRQELHAIADKMVWLDMYYRIHAYINEDLDDMIDQHNNSSSRVAGKGTHCSGNLWYANYITGKQMNIFYAPPSMIDAGAHSLYDSIKEMVLEQIKDQAGVFSFFLKGTADDIANQVVNGFGLDIYDDLSSTWKNYLGTVHTYAAAPDHLMLDSMINPEGNSTGVQTEESSYYKKIMTVQLTGGYWIDSDSGQTATAILYEHKDYGGAKKVLYGTGQWNIYQDFNDKVSSIRVAANHVITLFKHADFQGEVFQFAGKNSHVKPVNDWASSVRIEQETNHDKIVLFKHADFDDPVKAYLSEIDDPHLGKYNDEISSIQVAPGWKVTVYEHGNFGGWSKTFTSDTGYVGGSYNDEISSVKIRRQ